MEPKTTVVHNSVAYYQAHEDAYIATLAKGPPKGLPFNMTYRFPSDYKFQGMSRLLEMAHNLLKVSSCKFPQHPHVAGDIYSDVYYDDGYFFRLHIFIFKNDFCQIAEFFSPAGFYPNRRTRYYADDLNTALIPDCEGGHESDTVADRPRLNGDVPFYPMPKDLSFSNAICCESEHLSFLIFIKLKLEQLTLGLDQYALHWNHVNYVVATKSLYDGVGVLCHFYNCNGQFVVAWYLANDVPDARLRHIDHEWLTRDCDTGRNYIEMSTSGFIAFNEYLRARFEPSQIDYHKMSQDAGHAYTKPYKVGDRIMCFYYHHRNKTCHKLLLAGPAKHNRPITMFEAFDLYTQLLDLNFVRCRDHELQHHSSIRSHQYYYGQRRFYHVLHAGFGRKHTVIVLDCTTNSTVSWKGEKPNMLLPIGFWDNYVGLDSEAGGLDYQALGELSTAAMTMRANSTTEADHGAVQNYTAAIGSSGKEHTAKQLAQLKLRYELLSAGSIRMPMASRYHLAIPSSARESALRNVLEHLSSRGAHVNSRGFFDLELMAFHTESDIVAAQYCPLCKNHACLHHAGLASAFARFHAPLRDFAYPWSVLACGKLDDINEIQRCSVCHMFGCNCHWCESASVFARLNTAVKYHPNQALVIERPGPVNPIWKSLVYPYKRMSLQDLSIMAYNRAAIADMSLSDYYDLCDRYCTSVANWDGYTIMLPYYTTAHRVPVIPHIPCLKFGDHGFHMMFITYETDMAKYCRGLISNVVDTSIVTKIPRWYPLDLPEVD